MNEVHKHYKNVFILSFFPTLSRFPSKNAEGITFLRPRLLRADPGILIRPSLLPSFPVLDPTFGFPEKKLLLLLSHLPPLIKIY